MHAPALLSFTEAAAALGISRATLYRMIGDMRLDPVNVPNPSGRGEKPRIRRTDVDRIIAARENAIQRAS